VDIPTSIENERSFSNCLFVNIITQHSPVCKQNPEPSPNLVAGQFCCRLYPPLQFLRVGEEENSQDYPVIVRLDVEPHVLSAWFKMYWGKCCKTKETMQENTTQVVEQRPNLL